MEGYNESQRGQTIVEVVIALFLIAIIVPALANLLSNIVKSSRISYSETKEALLAAAKLEDIKSKGFANVGSGTGSDSSSDGCTIVWKVEKDFSESKIYASAFCPPYNQTRGVHLRTILIPE